MSEPAELIHRFHVEVCRPLERQAWVGSGMLAFGCWIGGAAVALAITSWSYWLVGGFLGGVLFSVLVGYALERKVAPGRPARMRARLKRFVEASGGTLDDETLSALRTAAEARTEPQKGTPDDRRAHYLVLLAVGLSPDEAQHRSRRVSGPA